MIPIQVGEPYPFLNGRAGLANVNAASSAISAALGTRTVINLSSTCLKRHGSVNDWVKILTNADVGGNWDGLISKRHWTDFNVPTLPPRPVIKLALSTTV